MQKIFSNYFKSISNLIMKMLMHQKFFFDSINIHYNYIILLLHQASYLSVFCQHILCLELSLHLNVMWRPLNLLPSVLCFVHQITLLCSIYIYLISTSWMQGLTLHTVDAVSFALQWTRIENNFALQL